jgi:molybdopterin biosynthesis enzyme
VSYGGGVSESAADLVPAVVKEMGERMTTLLDRSHGKRIQDYNT